VFQPEIRTFLKRWVAEGPTHHFALGIGHRADTLKKIAGILGIECAVVTPFAESQSPAGQ
jgi:L-arabinose isomerase